MAARAYGDANLNDGRDDAENYRANSSQNNKASRLTRHNLCNQINLAHHYEFKEFTRESLNEARKNRNEAPFATKRGKSFCTDNQGIVSRLKPAEPDPYLASGQQLPPTLIRQMPAELIGKPIEDIDPYYLDQETFVIISKGKELTRFSASKALYLFGPFHPIRRIVLHILVSTIFNLLVILTILTNCILMTIQGSELIERTEIIFTTVYTIEVGLKVLARGFILDKFTYLRDPWNWLDFSVIIMAYLTIVVEDLRNLSVIRTFRVLRALKTVAIIPGMKTIVGAVIDSVKNLKDVVVLTLFSLSVFSLLGLQIYMGVLTQKCILNSPNYNMSDLEWFDWCSNSSHWIPEPDSEIFGAYRLCGNATGAQSCPDTHTCIQGFGPNPDYGFTNFDTFGWALICSFRLMTQDFWEGIYMQILKTVGSWHIIFFIISIFLGSIYLMNLILAIVAMSYNELQRRAEEEEEAAAEDEAAFLESCRLMEIQERSSDLNSNSCNAKGTAGGYNTDSNSYHYDSSNRTSYRPSVEIGLVGQSLLASLCQKGFLEEQIKKKLDQQMITTSFGYPASLIGYNSNITNGGFADFRSHSLSIQCDTNNASKFDERGSEANKFKSTYLSMNELRRKSSAVRTPISQDDDVHFNHGDTCTKTSSTSQPGTQSSVQLANCKRNSLVKLNRSYSNKLCIPTGSCGLQEPFERKRSCNLFWRDENCEHGRRRECGRIGTEASAISDEDLCNLRQKAALIRIQRKLGLLDGNASSHSVQNGSMASLRNVRNSLNFEHFNNKQPRAKSQDYSTNQSDEQEPSRVCIVGAMFASEGTICTQPKSIQDSMQTNSSGNQSLVNQNSSVESRENQFNGRKFALRSQPDVAKASKVGSSSNLEHLNVNRCLSDSTRTNDRMRYLSVENFQQFGNPKSLLRSSIDADLYRRKRPSNVSVQDSEVRPLEAASNEPNEFKTSSVQQKHEEACHQRQQVASNGSLTGEPVDFSELTPPRFGRGRLKNRAEHIHPSIMMRSSFSRPRYSLATQSLFKPAGNQESQQQRARRASQDLVRRASEFSRISSNGNVDLRRLLRLWSHTNPYRGRASISSLHSNYSRRGPESPTNSLVHNPSHRASRVSSNSRQAYEVISALSRRHTRSYDNQSISISISQVQNNSNHNECSTNPLDDNLAYSSDEISINGRDRFLAYCLSCLDILCIWECCSFWLKIQRLIGLIVFDSFTELFIILCICINTLFMALDSDDADLQTKMIFERGNYFFTSIFAVEASMKIMALSPKFYFREGWNVFDSIIVGLSLLELGLEGVYGLSVLRTFRLLRVFKLAKSWPTLNLLISIMGKAVGDLGNLTFVLAIIVFIFAVMGMQLFGNKYVDHSFPSGELPRWNFTDFMHSFMIVFRILCAEWIEPMWDCLLVGGWPCIPFFLIAVTVGNLVVLNLFLALLLASFGASNLSSPQTADNVDTKKLQEAIGRFLRLAKWLRRKLNQLCRLMIALVLCKKFRREDRLNGPDVGPAAGRPIKSRIAAMSRFERMRKMEMRTQELKSKIRRSPEHHHHLRQLAKSQASQSRVDLVGANSTRGFNFNYKNHSAPVDLVGKSLLSKPIPIIVNDTDYNSSGTEVVEEGKKPFDTIHHFDDDQYYTSVALTPNRLSMSIDRDMLPIVEDSGELELAATMANDESSIQPEANKTTNSGSPTKTKMTISGDSTEVKDKEEPQNESEPPPEEAKWVTSHEGSFLEPPKVDEEDLVEVEEDERVFQHIERCICFGILCLKWFLFRQHVRRIVEHRYFDQCILILIVISSGTLALEDKHLSERPTLKRTLDVLDTIFTIIFSIEMLFKWLAFGIRRYFENIWSWLDFIIVLVSLINLMASIFGSGKIQALKTMRTLRAMRGLRPLRALQRFQGMRVVVNALIQAIPSIFNVLLVCLIFWLIFSIMGVQMFGGKFWRCLDRETQKVVSYEIAANKFECLSRNLTWSNPQINFDNVLNAYLALFQVATFKGWIDIMNSATDSRMRDDQPIREANIYMYFYFVFFVIVGSFFTLNLFIGVIIDNFNEQKKKTGGSLEIFMTEDQKKYYHAMKKMRSKRPTKAMTRPKLKLQAYMFDITTSKQFDMIIMIIIGLNMFVMALEHFGQSAEFSFILESLNLLFIAIFTLECLCKIFSMRHFYFREPWNIFDFVVVIFSILGVVMKEYVAKYLVSPTLLRVVRVVKVGRVLRLVKGAKGIRTLLFALAMSLPALFNICLLLFLVMFIYAIFGMSLFMNVRKRAGIDETFNFETFSSSIIVLFQMSTSAGWDLVLDPLMDEENDCQKHDPILGIEGTCGNKEIAIFYSVSYVIVTFLIIINMYIAVILENYSQATEDVQEGLTDDDYEMYYEIWQKFDPNGTQYLPYEKLSDFVDSLEDPLRIPKPNSMALVMLDINIYEGQQCYCVDILDALTKYFFTRKGLVIQVNEHLQKVQSTLHETPFERITTTYLLKRQHYCAKVIQNSWRRWKERSLMKTSAIEVHGNENDNKDAD